MKKVLITMTAMFVAMILCGGFWGLIFKPIIGGGVEQSFIYPLYAGIILLSGIIVGCTVIVLEKIESLKKDETDESK
ncbi:MAG: hypothetical protein Q4B96_03380 [Bacillota bacterium]|nr:hypothetical protein [Bacillota bacterium]